jgi:GAF domain-containing protein
MEPLPETRDALTLLDLVGEGELRDEVSRAAEQVGRLVPGLAAFSVGAVRQGITLTYVATSAESARLDAVQYVDDGPCQQAARTALVVTTEHGDLLDEGRWQLYAQASAAEGILSSLSLPVIERDVVVGGINLYGRRPDTFVGHHEEIADLFGAWAAGAVTNADLDFTTRTEATRAPRRLEDLQTVQHAVRLLASSSGVSRALAETRLYEAAARAGIPVLALALMVIGEDGGTCEPRDQQG